MFGDQGFPDVLPVGYGGNDREPSGYDYPSGVPDRGGPNLRPSSVPGSGGGAGPGWNTGGLPAGYGAAATPSGPYLDKTDTGNYAYRFYKSGEIVIIATGDAKRMPIGTTLTSKDAAWSAITSKFGTYEMQAQAQTKDMLSTVAPGVAAAVASAVQGAGFKPSKHSPKTPLDTTLAPPTESGSTLPYWIIGGGVLVVGGLVAYAMLSGNKKGKE